MACYGAVKMVFDRFEKNSRKDQVLIGFIRNCHAEMHNWFVDIFNKNINRWNDDFFEENPGKDGWCNEYANYIFDRYLQISKKFNREHDTFVLEMYPQLIPEQEDRAQYKGQMEPVYGVRVKGHPEKKMHIEFLPVAFDSVKKVAEYVNA